MTESQHLHPVKQFLSYEDQADLLKRRGMAIRDHGLALDVLRNVNYYRLSGYWYPFRMLSPSGMGRTDRFLAGTTFEDVRDLYLFDVRLRTAVLAAIEPIELALRARLGYLLGEIDPLIYLDPGALGPTARRKSSTAPSERYGKWLRKYQRELSSSREDFVAHHHSKYGGVLPVWAAVELLDWGGLTHLYGLSPASVRDALAHGVHLTGPQLESWLKSLNIVRNVAAHHGRLYNRVFALQPKLPRNAENDELSGLAETMTRSFGQLTLIQYLLHELGVGSRRILPRTFETYPDSAIVPFEHTGAPADWDSRVLWRG